MYLLSLGVLFALALTLPWLALAFFWLAERYSTKLAYSVLALIPPVCFVLVFKLERLLGPATDTLLRETVWLSLITFVFGLALMLRAFRRKARVGVLLLAAIVSLAPFALAVFMFYQMSRDGFLKSL